MLYCTCAVEGCAVDGSIARGYIAVLNQQFTVNGYIGPCFYVSQLSELCKLHEQAGLVPRLPSSFAYVAAEKARKPRDEAMARH